MSDWSPDTWRSLPIKQQPDYESKADVANVCASISTFPPLVASEEVERLRGLLAEVASGKRFLLQGGDCAERFADCSPAAVDSKLKIILQMSLVLVWGGRVPVVRIGRIAGQYAKPRSKPTEIVTIDGKDVEVPVFRGDIVNVHPLDSPLGVQGRKPDPKRMEEAYFRSAATLNFIRSRLSTGFADLHSASRWDLNFVDDEGKRGDYEGVLHSLRHCLDFLSACGISSDSELKAVDLFTSHEGLLLDYEAALTHRADSGEWYDLSAHMIWIGDRTRGIDDAHVEFFRGVRNPIGMKVGPTTDKGELVRLIKRLDPDNEPGRLVLYSRLGAKRVEELLPGFVGAVRDAGCTNVIWACDPMHGNTTSTKDGIKTRAFNDILGELISTFNVHDSLGSRLSGIHCELTGEDVTECTGGVNELTEADLHKNFVSYCDPRLNYSQSLEIAFLIAQHLSGKEKSGN